MKRLAALLLLYVCSGCSVDSTEMLVSVSSGDLQLDGVELDVFDPLLQDPARTLFAKTVSVCRDGESRPGCYELPVSITLVPGPKDPGDPVRVEAGGVVGSAVVVRDAAEFHFTRGQRQRIEFVLYANCVGTACADQGLACDANGDCVDVAPSPAGDLGADLTAPSDLSGADLMAADLSRAPDLAMPDLAMPDLAMPDQAEPPDLAQPPQFGDGQNGAVVFPTPGPTTIDLTATSINGNAGEATLHLATISNFGAGQTLLLHQSQGSGAGVWEIDYLAALDTNSNIATLRYPLAHSYLSDSGDAAQAIIVPRYADVTLPATGTLTAPAWNGATGGILVFQASGLVTLDGTIDMVGRGYRAPTHDCNYHNPLMTCDTAYGGYAGESSVGPGIVQTTPNGEGGGASAAGDCSGGAGGGYGTAGAHGTAACGQATPTGGLSAGMADLNQAILMGGGGGEGAGKSDCGPGPGAAGGGIVVILAHHIVVGLGGVSAGGATAHSGDVCGGSGCSVGGGGAGGAIRLVADQAELGGGTVTAPGGVGGAEACDGAHAGGTGGDGRIAVRSPSVTGSTVPAFFGN